MASSAKRPPSDPGVRHDIYTTLAQTSRPPTTREVVARLDASIAAVEDALERLAEARPIALAPGCPCIRMAHPFSGIPTD